MRWFTSFMLTAAGAGLVALILWARDQPPFGVQEISDALIWLVPGSAVLVIKKFQVLLLFGCWSAIRIVLTWALAYTTSTSEGSPRQPSRRGTAIREFAYHWFSNPARWWLTMFAALLTAAITASGVYVWLFSSDPILRLCWSLTALFGATVVATMAVPDRVEPLRNSGDDERIDPLMDLPGDPEEAMAG